jgi:putative glutathione S-transferase
MSRDAATISRELDAGGAFVRQQSSFRDRVTADGSSPYPAAAGRYHLYVSLACPWAHRTIIVRRLKGLESAIPMTVVDPVRDERGWRFDADRPDPVNGWSYLSEAYEATRPGFDARVTVPVLWDTATGRIVNNESAEILEMLNSEWDAVADNPELDLYPGALRAEIDELNAWIYANVNDGVYKAGFASSQQAYEAAVHPLFDVLDALEERLSSRRFLFGERQTLADWRLFTTLVRFDPVYVGHFKCNLRRIVDYPNLSGHLRDLYQTPGVAETVDFDHIKRHYYMTHGDINPTRIVPAGPVMDLTAPHGRENL